MKKNDRHFVFWIRTWKEEKKLRVNELMDINRYFEIVWIINWNLGQIFAQHRILLDAAALLKTLQHVLSLELNDTSTSHLPFENYTDCLLSHGLCSKFCSSLSWLSMDFVQPTCHPSFNNTTRNEAYAHPLNYFLRSILWTLWHTINMPFLSPHLYYGTVYRILLTIQHLFHLLNLPSKHSCFGSFVFDLFYE